MTQAPIKAEVRLFFNGRVGFDIEFFDATSNTDILHKAAEIAKHKKADHFNCGLATPEEEYKRLGPPRRGISLKEKDQIAAIQAEQEAFARARKER